MKENFARSLRALLRSEGGNDDDPHDHGGRTSRGVTQREYDAWRRERGMPLLDVWKAPDSDIATVYHDEYWNPHCDLLPIGVDYLFFDMAVNAGPARATKLMQRALGLREDGRVGPLTREAMKSADPRKLIDRYSDVKASFYIGLHQPRFTKGWLNRVRDVRATALTMLPQEGKSADA